MKTLPYFLFFFLQTVYMDAFSQKHNIKFEHLDINAGLSQNHILCILQDSRGFMWFGTRDGLNKYDGYQFTIYKNDPANKNSISNNFIAAITEDKNGIIWIATRGGGINSYDREKDRFTHFKNDPQNINSISSNLVDGLTEDENGNLWICTEDAGVDFFEVEKKKFSHYSHNKNLPNSLSDNNNRYIYRDSENNILVGSCNSGLNYFNKKTQTFINYQHDENNKSSISSNNVRAIFEDSKHRIWIGTIGGGLDLFDKKTGSFRHFVNDPHNSNRISVNVVAAIGEDDKGNIWIGTENGGLNIYDPVTETFQTYQHDEIDNKSISQNSIYSIYKDTNGNMWVGTFAGGLNIFSKNATRFTHYSHTSAATSLNNNNILCLAPNANGKIWVGTDGGGINLFDPVTANFQHFIHNTQNKNSICGDYVLSIYEDRNDNVWIGTWADGITVFNPKKNTFKHLKNNPADPHSLSNNNAWVIFEDSEKNIWIGTYGGGLNLYDPVNNNFIHFDDSTTNFVVKHIFSMSEDDKGNLWIGTDGGGIRIFNKKSKIFTTLVHSDDRNSLSDNRVNYLYKDAHNNFWINTMSGLNYFDTKTNKFTIYTTVNGLPNNVIFAVAEDANKNLWISTNKGLSKFNPATKVFENFSPADGLQSYEFKAHAVCKTQAGAIYFGGINGLNEFYPGKIKEHNFEPKPVFTSFLVFNKKIQIAANENDPSPLKKDISETKNITLSYKSAVISFEFASLNYTAQDKKQYSYKLEGFDKDWNFIGSKHSATYTNLDPKKYIFKVRALNDKGEWSSNISSIQLTITPPFWMTWWFRLTVLLFIIVSILFFIKYRLHTIEAQKLKLLQTVNEQTEQLIQSTREERIAREEAERAKLETDLANQELANKNKELQQFVYIASHDLQEPLRTTTSFIELLQRQYHGKFDEKADKYFNFITDASTRMKTLIKDLLDYSRIGAKKEFVKVDCNVIVKEVLADLGNAINQANAVITTDELPVITGYATEIKQLFQNLIINAIKFRKKDIDPLIKIAAENTDDHWKFSVSDNGIGIEEQHKEKIFLIFQRLHTKTQYEGSGIGLAHSKKIVELHGGKIWIDSKAGQGTIFFFTILKNIEP